MKRPVAERRALVLAAIAAGAATTREVCAATRLDYPAAASAVRQLRARGALHAAGPRSRMRYALTHDEVVERLRVYAAGVGTVVVRLDAADRARLAELRRFYGVDSSADLLRALVRERAHELGVTSRRVALARAAG